MATHQYTRESSGATVLAGQNHTFTTSVFSVPAGEQFVRLKVYMGPSGAGPLLMRGAAQTIFGGGGMWDQWATDVSGIWTNGSGVKVEVHNNGSAGLSKRLYAVIETEDLPRYAVTCNTSGNGTLKSNLATAYPGQTVTLTPKAGTGSSFSKYTTSPSVTITNNKFTMPNSAVTITAKFTVEKYAVTVNSEDTSKGTASGGGTFAYDSDVTITATAKPGYKFTHWTTTKGTIANPNAASTKFTVPAGAATVTAHFERSQSTVKLYKNGSFKECLVSVWDGSAWVDCDVYVYNNGTWEQCSHA